MYEKIKIPANTTYNFATNKVGQKSYRTTHTFAHLKAKLSMKFFSQISRILYGSHKRIQKYDRKIIYPPTETHREERRVNLCCTLKQKQLVM